MHALMIPAISSFHPSASKRSTYIAPGVTVFTYNFAFCDVSDVLEFQQPLVCHEMKR